MTFFRSAPSTEKFSQLAAAAFFFGPLTFGKQLLSGGSCFRLPLGRCFFRTRSREIVPTRLFAHFFEDISPVYSLLRDVSSSSAGKRDFGNVSVANGCSGGDALHMRTVSRTPLSAAFLLLPLLLCPSVRVSFPVYVEKNRPSSPPAFALFLPIRQKNSLLLRSPPHPSDHSLSHHPYVQPLLQRPIIHTCVGCTRQPKRPFTVGIGRGLGGPCISIRPLLLRSGYMFTHTMPWQGGRFFHALHKLATYDLCFLSIHCPRVWLSSSSLSVITVSVGRDKVEMG